MTGEQVETSGKPDKFGLLKALQFSAKVNSLVPDRPTPIGSRTLTFRGPIAAEADLASADPSTLAKPLRISSAALLGTILSSTYRPLPAPDVGGVNHVIRAKVDLASPPSARI